jgi:phage terminase large subunit-like protein
VSFSDPHVLKALDYCAKVRTGVIPACKYVRQACARQERDLERAAKGDPTFPYVFDENAAGRVCRFLEQLPHVKGPEAEKGALLVLELWQCFIVTTVFGWKRTTGKNAGKRRFRRAYVEVPRGNGKSFLCSGIGLYALSADGEMGSDVYSAATTTEQANITRGDADAMLKARPALKKKLGLKTTLHAIFQPSSNSTFKALSREAGNQEGKNIHVGIVDELHAHKTRDTWDVVISGAKKRTQSLIWTITTSGTDTAGVCYEVRSSVVKMLDGEETDQLFGIIYTIDEGDDWRDESSWSKANPNWHASIDQDAYRMDAIDAIRTASKENNFKTKHLDIWCNADVAWMSMSAWDACADLALKEESFAQQPVVLGLDLASKIDFAAESRLYFRDLPAGTDEKNGDPRLERHYFLFMRFFLPEAAVERSSNSQLAGWVKEGRIIITPGDVLDFDAVRDSMRQARAHARVREVAFDPWQAQDLANQMGGPDEGFVMVELKPTVQNFSAPMKEFEALVLAKRLHHDGDPVMRWMVSNVVCHRDAKDNIYPRKESPEKKIDGPVSAFMALNRSMLAPLVSHPYESRGLLML